LKEIKSNTQRKSLKCGSEVLNSSESRAWSDLAGASLSPTCCAKTWRNMKENEIVEKA
jgi:hypothetical protein